MGKHEIINMNADYCINIIFHIIEVIELGNNLSIWHYECMYDCIKRAKTYIKLLFSSKNRDNMYMP